METAYLKVSVTQNPLGTRDSMTYEWEGDSPYVRITGRSIDALAPGQSFPARLDLGPYKLLFVQDEPWIDCALYVREDKFGALRVTLYKATRLLDFVYRRLIITLAVWNLADYHEAAVPSWKDIKALKRFIKK